MLRLRSSIAACIWPPDPPGWPPPRSATPPGECGRARLARERATRPPRALRSRTRARRQPRVTCAGPWQQQQRAPWQQPAPPRPRRGCGEGVRPSRGARSALRLPPGRAPAPRSPLTSLARVPQACAAGCCCWLRLLLLLAPTTSGWGGPVAQPHHIRRLSSAHGARLGLRTFSGPERPVVGARPSPPPPPHLPLPPPNPPHTHVLGQPLRSR